MFCVRLTANIIGFVSPSSLALKDTAVLRFSWLIGGGDQLKTGPALRFGRNAQCFLAKFVNVISVSI